MRPNWGGVGGVHPPGYGPGGSILRQESDVNWRRNFDNPSGRRQAARRGINLEHDNVVRELILRQQVFAARIDGKVPRLLPASRHVGDGSQRSLRRMDRKNRDAVVSAIRGVKEFSVGMHGDLRRIVPPGKTLRQCRNLLNWIKESFFGVAKYSHRGIEFAQCIDKLPEVFQSRYGRMARARTWVKC